MNDTSIVLNALNSATSASACAWTEGFCLPIIVFSMLSLGSAIYRGDITAAVISSVWMMGAFAVRGYAEECYLANMQKIKDLRLWR
jgi:hypothetical protein